MFLVALGVGAYFVMRGDTTFGNLIAIVQLLNYIVMPVAGIAAAIAQIGQAKASAGRIGEIINLPADTGMAESDPVDAMELTAENVRFSYQSEEADTVLENVNAAFAKGLVTGIVGKSGSGKSTLLKLLIGLYAPAQGRVWLKHASGELSGEEIMAQVAYVPPVDYLFSGSVEDNIIMSEEEPRLSNMKEAASGANILDFIESLPEGFDTEIGESGGTVSSGQAQRIAIARAIYKRSPVVVFDEPTANLDADSIEKFQSAIKNLAKDKICIVVTHDASTMTVCDKVYLLEDGRVREKQSDEELTISA
jgi:subfamily B ATP-binding cassette protein MsbA